MISYSVAFFSCLLIFWSLEGRTDGHSFLVVPKGDFKSFQKPECRLGGPPHAPNDMCPGPCINENSWQYDKASTTTTYKRGQVLSLVWARNNHRGGFVRFSLVPQSQRMNKTAHKLMSFRYACFDSDQHLCTFDTSKERRCGTDVWLHRTDVTIPTSYEDGYYTLGFAWFGGLNLAMVSMFGDYWSCAKIKIQGGPLTPEYAPVFKPGENLRQVDQNNPTCKSSTNDVGICWREPCSGLRGMDLKPAPFMHGNGPIAIRREWTLPPFTASTASVAPSSSPTATSSPSPLGAKPSYTPAPARPSHLPVSSPIKGSAHVTGLRLIDVKTREVYSKTFYRKIRIPTHNHGISFIAKVTGEAESVHFFINDKYVRTEKQKPYTCFGDVDGNIYPWHDPIFDEWFKINVTAAGVDKQQNYKVFWLRLVE